MDDPDSSFLDMTGSSGHEHPAPATQQHQHQSTQHGDNFLDMQQGEEDDSFLNMGHERAGEDEHAAPHTTDPIHPDQMHPDQMHPDQMHPDQMHPDQMHPSTYDQHGFQSPGAGGRHFSGAYSSHNTDNIHGAEYEPGEHQEGPPESATTMVDPAMMGFDDEEILVPHQNAMENLGYSGAFAHLPPQQEEDYDKDGYQAYHGQ
ncbi:uncharacterized protein Z519_08082 [Cladophialophora bantiana CBS 173.52]|uniref:Uncharacterized protein n=1 Tax=Cladophialophora bantiana (strain ATCC 10958 / CBS 173.52 / CDC B-1940 / NIH 8579) TaxID=1442370 RepID=A0A0D2FXH0_CLAB1|nr:uncharacterized protein Z519_08082 [Cladophialophora bantiana CBS 173.52]KIW91187.1 hypothetical protein Z519_08082 [Cladophialophora bantiana CBS 173.52]